MNPLIAEFSLVDKQKSKSERLKHEDLTRPLTFNMEGPRNKGCTRWPLGAKSDPWLTTGKEIRTSEIHPQESDFYPKT